MVQTGPKTQGGGRRGGCFNSRYFLGVCCLAVWRVNTYVVEFIAFEIFLGLEGVKEGRRT